MRHVSEVHTIPGNAALSERNRQERILAFYHPFHNQVSTVLDDLEAQGKNPIIVTIHSFTPIYHGEKRRVELGILHDTDSRLADEMLGLASAHTDLTTMRNEPYGPSDGVAHTLAQHALPRGHLNVMIEIRNDLITTPGQQQPIADDLARMLCSALNRLGRSTANLIRSTEAQA